MPILGVSLRQSASLERSRVFVRSSVRSTCARDEHVRNRSKSHAQTSYVAPRGRAIAGVRCDVV